MCYICGHTIKGYDHFTEGGCNLWSNGIPRLIERPRHEVLLSFKAIFNSFSK